MSPFCWPCPGTPSRAGVSGRAQLFCLVSQSHKQSVRQKNDVTSPGIDQPPVCCVILWLSPMLSDQRAQLIRVTSKIVQKLLPFLVSVNTS